ncbi:unnamed protein product [Symbiodinium microadriaticum]|nr:unnamed protein product [Symbiodinium microadriaticum]
MLCSVHHAPRYVAPHPSLRLGLVQSQDVAARAAAEASEAAKPKPPSYTARVAAEKFASVQIRASVPDAAAKAGVPAGQGCWACWRPCYEQHASQQFSWVIHHSSDVNGQTKREQSWVGLLDEAGGDFYRFNCFDLEATADPRLMQQSPDGRLDHVVDKKKAMAKAALRRRGSAVTLQVVMELQTSPQLAYAGVTWVFISGSALFLFAGPFHAMLVPDSAVAQQGYGQLQYQLPGKPQDRFSKFDFPMLVWPSFEYAAAGTVFPSSRFEVYACYAEMAESEAIPFEHPANDRARRRVLGRLAQPWL